MAVVVGTLMLKTNWTTGQLLIAIGLLGYTVSGITTVLFARKAGSSTRFFQPMWGRFPRIVWILGAVGLFFALTNVVFAFTPHP